MAVGTVNNRRLNLPVERGKQIEKGEMFAARSGPVLFTKWMDTREVLTLSTSHRNEMIQMVCKASTKTGGRTVKKFKPATVVAYNKNKTGVDRADQMISYYPFHRKTLKWWKKVFFHLFTMSVTNAFVLYKSTNGRSGRYSLETFVTNLMEQLALKITTNRRKVGNVPIPCDMIRLNRTRQHFPVEIGQRRRRRCAVCSKRKLRREVTLKCDVCDVALCVGVRPCFIHYHTKQNY